MEYETEVSVTVDHTHKRHFNSAAARLGTSTCCTVTERSRVQETEDGRAIVREEAQESRTVSDKRASHDKVRASIPRCIVRERHPARL